MRWSEALVTELWSRVHVTHRAAVKRFGDISPIPGTKRFVSATFLGEKV